MKIYIVDDEIMAVDYFRMLLESCGTEYKLSGYSTNSLLAYDEIIKMQPDIVFIDVNMPVLTGIELAERILKVRPDEKIVFLTAYRDFDFIKQGMDLGIETYLLKNELTTESLAVELNKIEQKISDENVNKRIRYNERIRQYLLGREKEPEIGRLKTGHYYFFVYFVKKRSFSLQRITDTIEEIQILHFFEDLKNPGEYLIATLHIKDNVWGLIYDIDEEKNSALIVKKAQGYFSENDITTIAVASPKCKTLGEVKDFYKRISVIDNRRLFWGDKDVLIDTDIMTLSTEERQNFNYYENQIRKAIEKENRKELHFLLADALSIITQNANDTQYIKCMQDIFGDFLWAMHNSGYLNEIPAEWDSLEFVSCSEFNQWLLQTISEYYRSLQDGNNKKYSSRVIKIISYIENNYSNSGLSSSEISKKLNFSESYLRKLFKDEMKVSISDYLLQYRIEVAKKLLIKPNSKASEVYSKVGFSTSQYFSTVFKKKTGLTPKEYQRLGEH